MAATTEEQVKDMRERVLRGEEVPETELAACLDAYRKTREKDDKAKVERQEKTEAIKQKQLNLDDLFKKD